MKAAKMDKSEEIEVLESRIRDLEALLRQNDHRTMVAYRLTPVLNNIFGLLLSQELVMPEMIEHRLELTGDAKVAMYRLRQHMKPYGVEIHSTRKVGYWLDPETKDKVRRTLDAIATPEGIGK